MKRHLVAKVTTLSVLIILACAILGWSQSGVRSGSVKQPIKLTGKLGLLNLFLETLPPNRANAPTGNKLKINLFLENGKLSFIGENGLVCGIIGDSGRLALPIGAQVIGLYDGSGKRVGGIDANGNIRMIIGDSGRFALIGENGNELGYIGENGILSLKR